MPPLMGAGAFIMVELTGIPYTEVILAASIPALLYFYTVWIGVNRYADLFDLKPVDTSDQPKKSELLITVSFFAIPFAFLLWLMFSGYTPQYAAALAAVLACLSIIFRVGWKAGFHSRPKSNRPSYSDFRSSNFDDRVYYIVCFIDHWCARYHRPRCKNYFTDFVCLWRQPLPNFGAYSDCLSFWVWRSLQPLRM